MVFPWGPHCGRGGHTYSGYTHTALRKMPMLTAHTAVRETSIIQWVLSCGTLHTGTLSHFFLNQRISRCIKAGWWKCYQASIKCHESIKEKGWFTLQINTCVPTVHQTLFWASTHCYSFWLENFEKMTWRSWHVCWTLKFTFMDLNRHQWAWEDFKRSYKSSWTGVDSSGKGYNGQAYKGNISQNHWGKGL